MNRLVFLLLLALTICGCLPSYRGAILNDSTSSEMRRESLADQNLAVSILRNYPEQNLSFIERANLEWLRNRLEKCQTGAYDDYGTDIFSCIAISSYLSASTYEKLRSDPNRTLDSYRRGFNAIVEKKKRVAESLSSFDRFFASRNLCGAIAMSVAIGDKAQVQSLMHTADNMFSIDERYTLNKDCLLFANIIYIGNYEDLLRRTIQARRQLDARHADLGLSTLNPFNHLGKWSEQQVLDMFEAWALFQSGKEERFRRMFDDEDAFANSALASFLVWGSRTTGILSDERKMLEAFAGYGYGLLGEHESARQHMDAALSPNDTCNGDNKFLYWAVRAAYVDAVALPYLEYPRAAHLLSESEDCLNREDNIPFLFRPPFPEMFYGYPELLAGKMAFQQDNFHAAINQLARAWSLMGVRTPRQLQIDTVYYWGQACLKSRHVCNVEEFARAIDSTTKSASLFDGYELWKLWIAKAYLAELKGNYTEALASLDLAVQYAQRLKGPGWIQQYTFMEDKWRPYIERIKVATLLYKQGQLSADSMFRIRSEYKARVASMNAPPSYSPKILSLASFQDRLPKNSVALDIFYDEDKLSVLQIQRNSVALSEKDIHATEVKTAIETVNFNFSNKAQVDQREGEYFWSLLGLASLGKTDNATLFVSPHRQFHYLPWNAVSTAANDENLTVKTVILPLGLGVNFGTLHPTSARRYGIVFGEIENIGDPEKFSFIASLPRNVPRSILAGRDSTTENVKSLLSTSSLVIFYAHGVFNKRNEDLEKAVMSGIRLGSGETFSMRDMSEVSDNRARTIVLASCEAGSMPNPSKLPREVLIHRFPEATDVLSVYHLFLSRGVDTVIIGVNKINVTRDALVNEFLHFIDSGEEGDEAMYHAQKLMAQSGRLLKEWADLMTVRNGI